MKYGKNSLNLASKIREYTMLILTSLRLLIFKNLVFIITYYFA